MNNLRVAIIHEWFVTYAGSERVLEQIIEVFPDADLYGLVDFLPSDQRGFIKGKSVKTSFIQKLPMARKKYRNYLPFMPIAVEQFDLSAYDLVISSSHAVAKGVLTGPDQLHVCMCYSPMRYAWDLQHQYLRESRLTHGLSGWLAKWILHKMRIWDSRTANGVDHFIAISEFIARRIKKIYGRESVVIYPPVDTDAFQPHSKKDDFYLTASRMVPYKKIELIVSAFSKMPDKKLVVIGDGPMFEKIKSLKTDNIELLGHQPFGVLKEYMQKARAFLFAAEEDFGIVVVEAQACGTPVIAFKKGGASETVNGISSDMPTGVFFLEQNEKSICDAINLFESNSGKILAENCRKNAMRFSEQRFRSEFVSYIQNTLHQFRAGLKGNP